MHTIYDDIVKHFQDSMIFAVRTREQPQRDRRLGRRISRFDDDIKRYLRWTDSHKRCLLIRYQEKR